MSVRLPRVVPEVRPLVGADADRACRRHVYCASISGKGPAAVPNQGPSVHYYSKHLDTLGTPRITRVIKKPGLKSAPSALMGSAPTGRGEYPVPVVGCNPRRPPSMANLQAAAIEQMMFENGKLSGPAGTPSSLPPIKASAWQHIQKHHPHVGGKDRASLVRIPQRSEGVSRQRAA
mmetsp:Transcript_105990/g.252923  ORF Transcript_105990/g.252923 Transcript_105990/m.252923 type:complete len:176 (-) Transcript_105990:315-842(-)|eukprot:CAMPEP_0181489532 /NCGR_PEP_ID=MMETSP1110-20121109/49042_1 /TAXON_ID=174948 /ORGANISM="Symbiodinium sp., Strain CCMP421" /LENGTH=175 /DNA_ID=CAMNT_0023616391 /DNA_START=24 /DNA_END=551 /DNA_ORIENTATION=-